MVILVKYQIYRVNERIMINFKTSYYLKWKVVFKVLQKDVSNKHIYIYMYGFEVLQI